MPCVSILLFILVGVLLAHFNPWESLQNLSLNLAACLLVLLINVAYVKTQDFRFNITIMVLLILLGFTRYNLRQTDLHPYAQEILSQKEQLIEACIEKKEEKNKRTQLTLIVTQLCNDQQCVKLDNERILLYKKPTEECNLKIGDRIKGKTRLSPPRTNTNPNAFDYKTFLHYKGIDLVGNYNCQNFEILTHSAPYKITNVVKSIRNYCLGIFQNKLKKKGHTQLCSALVLGQKSSLTKKMKRSFSDAGAMHVLAVSGLHVGILVQMLLFICSLFKAKSRNWIFVQNVIVVSIVWMFVLLTGSSPSVLRAASMLSLFVFARHFYRQTNAYNIIAGTAVILILADPYILFQVSFQFSYLALTSIIFFYPLISKIISPPYLVLRYFWQITALSLAAQILILPLSLFYFHKAPWYSALSSLIAVPAAGIIIGTSLILFICAPLSDLLASKLSLLISYTCELLIRSVNTIQKLPLAEDFFIAFGLPQLFLSYGIIISLAAMISYKTKRTTLAIAGMILTLGLLASFIHHSAKAVNNTEVVIYESYKGLIMDIFVGKQCYQISDAKISSEEIQFTTGNNRIQKGITEVQALSPASKITEQSIASQDRYWQIKDKLIVMLNEETALPLEEILKPELLIIEHCSTTKLKEALQFIDPKEIVVAPGNNWRKAKKIKEILNQNKKIPNHDIRESGSYQKKI